MIIHKYKKVFAAIILFKNKPLRKPLTQAIHFFSKFKHQKIIAMRYYPKFLQEKLVINTTTLLAKQYKTFSTLYKEPEENEAKIMATIVNYRYLNKSKKKEQALLDKIPDLLNLHDLVIEILDQEQGFNSLPLPRQCALENLMYEVLEEREILC